MTALAAAERVVALWVAFVQGEFAFVQGEFPCVVMCSGGALLVHYLVVLLFVYRWRGALLASPVRSRYEFCSQVDLVSVLCLELCSLEELELFHC